jgi:oligopeptide/dipeptide ABC transporter ATP-binding protein
VAKLCDRVSVMYGGQIVEDASVDELFRRPSHPYTEGLLAAIPRLGPVRRHLDAIPGTVPSLGAMPAGCRFHPRCAYAVDACRTDPVQLFPHGAGHETRCLRHDALELRGVPEPDPEPAGELVPELLR